MKSNPPDRRKKGEIVKNAIKTKNGKIKWLGDILQALHNLKHFLDKEDPSSIFVWTIESKIRAYENKLKKVLKEIGVCEK